ncbi:MAG: hypothetical protein JJ953_01655 [Gracilimonas sp.]|uniref:hypothetical protein n=1 Tax=Gracilimonas TaxID=649462 RepID=UPI001AFFD762|nr:hypothetical protein [Gracilimonas sp.]MBO6584788.1 hypothetical protein [Gracilimonas sp.]MBO6615941.1 hypothetical protein [Gracilimonas sp.]
MNEIRYTKDGRLEDILALIQVLALHEFSHRSDTGLQNELPEKPKSAKNWLELANEHREFFRVVEGKSNSISLVARHLSKDEKNNRPPLSPEQTQTLLNTAIELHDRQIKRESRWAILIPIWVAVIGGIISVINYFSN